MDRIHSFAALAFLFGVSSPPQPAAGPLIPAYQGMTFSGEAVTLPDALHGRAGLLIVGFTQASRQQASDWGHKLAADPQRPARLAYFEMPILESVPRLARGFVLKKIKESVSANGQAHFLPVLDHEADWKRVAGYSNPDDAYLLLVDEHGVVHWRGEGPFTQQTYAEVKAQTLHLVP